MRYLYFIFLALASGCTTVITPTGQQYTVVASGYQIVNNTGVLIDVVQDGTTVATSLATGQVLPLRPLLFQRKTVVIAIGYTAQHEYVGSANWTFICETPEVWEVRALNRPEPVWPRN